MEQLGFPSQLVITIKTDVNYMASSRFLVVFSILICCFESFPRFIKILPYEIKLIKNIWGMTWKLFFHWIICKWNIFFQSYSSLQNHIGNKNVTTCRRNDATKKKTTRTNTPPESWNKSRPTRLDTEYRRRCNCTLHNCVHSFHDSEYAIGGIFSPCALPLWKVCFCVP